MLFVVPPLITPKYWRGPVLGASVSYISPTHTHALFLEFGKLTGAGDSGRYPTGEYTLSSFASFPAWRLRRNGGVLATSTDGEGQSPSAIDRPSIEDPGDG